jgi:hypothetical protein
MILFPQLSAEHGMCYKDSDDTKSAYKDTVGEMEGSDGIYFFLIFSSLHLPETFSRMRGHLVRASKSMELNCDYELRVNPRTQKHIAVHLLYFL